MEYLPISLKLAGRRCLIVGAGAVAARKVRQLRTAQADVSVVAPQLCEELRELLDHEQIRHIPGHFSEDMLARQFLVVAATDDQSLNQRVSELAEARNLLVNVVDTPDLCNFITPSIVNREPLRIAISTDGSFPLLASALRAKIETLIPASYGRLAQLLGSFRAKAKERFPELQQRRRFWEKVLQGPIAEMVYAGREQLATAALEQALQTQAPDVDGGGEVYLVGAGPGDPDLLTFRALRLMQQAEIIVYDRLVAPEIIELCRKDAERIYVGKKRDQHTLSQTEINRLLVDLARQGKRVLRLKGGDPFIFGRGGEEIASLSAEKIPFQVAPGITAASGCASYAGIPLTHREYAHTCVFVTGHLKDGALKLNWQSLVQPLQTLAVYMGVASLEVLCRELIAHGMPPETPAALVQQGTTRKQKVYGGVLSELARLPRQYDIRPPAMAIIGEVVKLREQLAWFQPQDNRKSTDME